MSSTKKALRKAPLEMELRLEEWGPKGATLASVDGRRIQVDRGIPGEAVLAAVDRRRTPWRGVVETTLAPSPDRVTPPCPYYAAGCGGCQWQHLSYKAQVEQKRVLVDREMERVGLDVRVSAVHAMEEPWRYRRTAAIALGWEAGFRPRGRRGIVEIHDCPISHPLIGRLADDLNRLLRADAIPRYRGKVWVDCTVVGSDREPGIQTVLQGIEGLTLESHPELLQVAEAIASLEGVVSVSFRHRTGEVRPLVGELMSRIELAGRCMWVPAGAFFQTNVRMVERLLRRIESNLDELTIRRAADIYGGVGTFGLALASRVERMTLVELDASAVEAAQRTAGDWGLDNMAFLSRHAETALPELSDLDVVIVDPPRSGLGEVVTGALAESAPETVVYVSCGPPSLARDLAALRAAGYLIGPLEMFDFYPHTYHAECLTLLSRVG